MWTNLTQPSSLIRFVVSPIVSVASIVMLVLSPLSFVFNHKRYCINSVDSITTIVGYVAVYRSAQITSLGRWRSERRQTTTPRWVAPLAGSMSCRSTCDQRALTMLAPGCAQLHGVSMVYPWCTRGVPQNGFCSCQKWSLGGKEGPAFVDKELQWPVYYQFHGHTTS